MPYTSLPSDTRTYGRVKTKQSQTMLMKCVRCGYEGAPKMVTGASAFPIYKCPNCNTIAQKITGQVQSE